MRKIALLFAFFCFLGMQSQTTPIAPMVNVTGEGTVKVEPDQVIIKSRIEHEGDNAQQVKKQNDKTVNAIIQYLKREGVKEKNVKTEYVNLNKRYNYNDKTESYVANQSISIKLTDIEDYEKIIKGLLENGLNRIDGIQFLSSDIKKYEKEARKIAVLDAKEKASQYAEPLGQKIGKAVSINESGGNFVQPVYRMAEMKMSDMPEEQQTIAPGQLEIKVKVSIGFQLL